jgi:hypothetical protein
MVDVVPEKAVHEQKSVVEDVRNTKEDVAIFFIYLRGRLRSLGFFLP